MYNKLLIIILLFVSLMASSCSYTKETKTIYASSPENVCILTGGTLNSTIRVIDTNQPPISITAGDPYKIMVVLESENSSDAIPLPMVTSELIAIILKQCYNVDVSKDIQYE